MSKSLKSLIPYFVFPTQTKNTFKHLNYFVQHFEAHCKSMRLVDVQCKPLQCWCVQVAGVARICHGNNSPLPSDRNSAAQPHHSLVTVTGAGALFAGMWRPERSQSTFNLRFCQAVKLVAGGAMWMLKQTVVLLGIIPI